jgi:hypothetical protein
MWLSADGMPNRSVCLVQQWLTALCPTGLLAATELQQPAAAGAAGLGQVAMYHCLLLLLLLLPLWLYWRWHP